MRSNGSSSTTDAGPAGADASADAGVAAEDTRPTILFLHGTRLTGSSWAAQVRALGDEFHCLAPDLPGHGAQAAVPFAIDDAADRAAAVIASEAHGGRAIVVGLSLGGYLAMAVAARHPERVAGLVVAGATAEPIGVRSWFYRGLATAFTVIPGPLITRMNRWFFRYRYPREIGDPILQGGFWFAGGAVALRSLVGQEFRPRLAAYPGPSLLINGQLDVFFRPTERRFVRAATSPSRATLRRATHLANLDAPEAFTEAVRAFARSVPSG